VERKLSETAAKTELAGLLKELLRVRELLEDEGSEKSLVADVMRAQLSILQTRIRQHSTQYGLVVERHELLPVPRPDRDGGRRG
jgi:hypothetical protein